MDKAKENFLKAFGFFKGKWDAASRNARIITLGVSAAVLISVITLVALSNRVDYEIIYSGVQSTEASEMLTALQELGIPARFTGNNISVPAELADDARIELAIQGFPRSTTLDYGVWNESIGIFSTDAQTREVQRQQLETRLTATLRRINHVTDAAVTITPPESRPYVLNPNRRASQASVLLTLTPGVRLNNRQIEGIQHLILAAVPELTPENLWIANQDGIGLIADEAGTVEEQIALDRQRLFMQRQFERDLEEDLETKIAGIFTGVVKDFRTAVRAELDFNNWIEEELTYTGANTDPETGEIRGIIENHTNRVAWNMLVPEDGMVGTTVNADISPGFPTWVGEPGSEAYYEHLNTNNYLVNERKRQTTSNGYSVGRVTASVQLDVGTQMTGDEIDQYRRLVAFVIGAFEEDVQIIPTNFLLAPPDTVPPIHVSPVRNVLVFIIISLGALLVILFILAIMSSGSKKRRLIRSRAAAFQGATPTFAEEGGFGSFPVGKPFEEEPEKIEIQSLLGAGEGETRDALLKNEIREFAKTNPDIVAQLIRTWIREA